MNTDQTSKSVYRRGADDGFIFGAYLSAMFLLQALSLVYDSLTASLIGLIMILAVPAVIYFFLRRAYRADGRCTRFSAIWLHGICIFFFGSLLMALTSYIYMRLVHPAFIPEVFDTLRDAYGIIDSEEARKMVRWIEYVQQHNLYPTAAELAVNFIWLAVFTGSLLSMIISFVIKSINPAGRRTPPPMPGQ